MLTISAPATFCPTAVRVASTVASSSVTMTVPDIKPTVVGDMGFDPLQIADSPDKLAWYREAEVKHARLAMLAAAGWPVAEKLNGPLSSALGQKSLLVDGRAPSILNGGLGDVNAVYWAAALGLAVFAESKYIDSQLNTGKRSSEYLPGMLEFDPLGQDSASMRAADSAYAAAAASRASAARDVSAGLA